MDVDPLSLHPQSDGVGDPPPSSILHPPLVGKSEVKHTQNNRGEGRGEGEGETHHHPSPNRPRGGNLPSIPPPRRACGRIPRGRRQTLGGRIERTRNRMQAHSNPPSKRRKKGKTGPAQRKQKTIGRVIRDLKMRWNPEACVLLSCFDPSSVDVFLDRFSIDTRARAGSLLRVPTFPFFATLGANALRERPTRRLVKPKNKVRPQSQTTSSDERHRHPCGHPTRKPMGPCSEGTKIDQRHRPFDLEVDPTLRATRISNRDRTASEGASPHRIVGGRHARVRPRQRSDLFVRVSFRSFRSKRFVQARRGTHAVGSTHARSLGIASHVSWFCGSAWAFAPFMDPRPSCLSLVRTGVWREDFLGREGGSSVGSPVSFEPLGWWV